MGNLGTGEIVIITFVLLGLFGTKKLNSVARGLGETNKEFKKVKKQYDSTIKNFEKDLNRTINSVTEDIEEEGVEGTEE